MNTLVAVHGWVAECMASGPPPLSELAELESDYRYRYLIEAIDVRVDFIVVVHTRLMLITHVA